MNRCRHVYISFDIILLRRTKVVALLNLLQPFTLRQSMSALYPPRYKSLYLGLVTARSFRTMFL